MVSSEDKPEIAFFDVETSVPTRPGQKFAILEFGAILVCPRKLIELENYSTLVRPADLSLISNFSVRCNGITKDKVVTAPTFTEIADKVYDILHGRIWAGHNILKFDCARIREAFAEINRPAPEPKGTIDSLALLTRRFGRRAGDMKMATLATYFGLGRQTHRSLDDVRMNLEVLKYCATVLFLESSLPDIFTENNRVSATATMRSSSNGKASPEGVRLDADKPSSSSNKVENHVTSFPTNYVNEQTHPVLALMTPNGNQDIPDLSEPNSARADPFDMTVLSQEMVRETLQPADSIKEEEESGLASRESSTTTSSDSFLEPNEISTPSISVILSPSYCGTLKINILHKDVALQLCCRRLKVRFGISTKFIHGAGRPLLSFVVDASPGLCQILDASDYLAQRLSVDSGSSSAWRPAVTRKPGFMNSPTIRLRLPTIADGNVIRCATEIYHKEPSSTTRRLVFSKFDINELNSLFTPGNFVDTCFSLDTYDYQQSAGIRLVAKKLIVHLNSQLTN